MRMKATKLLQVFFGIALLLNVSCNNDRSDDIPNPPTGAYTQGIIISNEGNFTTPNASVSFATNDFGTVNQDIYNKVNNEITGDVLNTIGFKGDFAYLVLNYSNQIKIVNRYTFKKVGEITKEIVNPRYIAFTDKYIYVTNDKYQGGKYVSIYNISDLSFVKKIDVSNVAERIATANGNIFVQNASFGFGNKISYVNGSTNNLQSEITIPNGQIQNIVPYNDNIYVLSSDASTTDSYIYTLSDTGAITKTTILKGVSQASKLRIDSGKFYYATGVKVYAMDMNATAIPTTPIITASASDQYSGLYGFDVIDGKIYTADSNKFTANSTVTVYSLTGNVLKTFEAGRGTNGFYKN
ncbi:hypothetical protein CMT42_01525 [Elizabethkingia anophelis]|nr:hypothetical protein BBD28_17090 [Elizabethkingia anophelis]AQW99358.1 hypothetical protein BBD31_16315 [Elizabethkingia anophelis]AQX89903.1 hypothetical protein AYC67_13140 [Elizabethkingia anophelis]ASV79225.1 hypothetical protein A6J37_11680 [Elizabethkingia anophelis]EHM7980278.1 hypothetical protein [Elizabethkingia anophelis]